MVIHACSQRSSPVKNRMREICTSGSVGGEGGNVLTYPARKHRASALVLRDATLRVAPQDEGSENRRDEGYPNSLRTIAAPSASAFNFPNATSRDRYFMPQSGAGMSRSADTYFNPVRMRVATSSGRST